MFAASDALLGQKAAAVLERASEDAEEAGRGARALHVFRLFVGGDVECSSGPGVEIREDSGLPLPVGEVSRGDAIVVGLDLRPDHDDLLGMRVGQGGEQRRVIYGEDSRVGADAEGQSEQDRDGEAGILAQHAQGEAEILEQSLHRVT